MNDRQKAERILELQEELESAQEELHSEEGRKKQILLQLKKEHNIPNTKKAKVVIQSLIQKGEKINLKIEKALEVVENEL